MLSDNEKISIELQEQYRHEVAQRFKTKSKIDYIETGVKILQGLAIVIGIWATYNEFRKQNVANAQLEKEKLEQQEKENRQTAKEFSKGFHQKQLDYYAEALDATSTLATEEKNSPDYLKARNAFYRLFWGRMSFVEDKCVEAKMVQFEMLLKEYEKQSDLSGELYDSCANKSYIISSSQESLKQACIRLAHEARHYTINTYLDSIERKNYNSR